MEEAPVKVFPVCLALDQINWERIFKVTAGDMPQLMLQAVRQKLRREARVQVDRVCAVAVRRDGGGIRIIWELHIVNEIVNAFYQIVSFHVSTCAAPR